jgi:hypothetical protein
LWLWLWLGGGRVSINRAVWWPAAVGTVLKLGAGLLGGLAFKLVRADGTAKEVRQLLTASSHTHLAAHTR